MDQDKIIPPPPLGFVLDGLPTGFVLDAPPPPKGFVLDQIKPELSAGDLSDEEKAMGLPLMFQGAPIPGTEDFARRGIAAPPSIPPEMPPEAVSDEEKGVSTAVSETSFWQKLKSGIIDKLGGTAEAAIGLGSVYGAIPVAGAELAGKLGIGSQSDIVNKLTDVASRAIGLKPEPIPQKPLSVKQAWADAKKRMEELSYAPKTEWGKAVTSVGAAPLTALTGIFDKIISEIPQQNLPFPLNKIDPEEAQAIMEMMGTIGAFALLPKISRATKGYLDKIVSEGKPLLAKDLKVMASDVSDLPKETQAKIQSIPDETVMIQDTQKLLGPAAWYVGKEGVATRTPEMIEAIEAPEPGIIYSGTTPQGRVIPPMKPVGNRLKFTPTEDGGFTIEQAEPFYAPEGIGTKAEMKAEVGQKRLATKAEIEKEMIRRREVAQERRELFPFLPHDSPTIWFDVMRATKGEGIRPDYSGKTAGEKGRFIEEDYSLIPKQLRNEKSSYTIDKVAESLWQTGKYDREIGVDYQGTRSFDPERLRETLYESEKAGGMVGPKPDERLIAEESAPKEYWERKEAEEAERAKADDLLKKTGAQKEDIDALKADAFLDGEKIRNVIDRVDKGEIKEDVAVLELQKMIEKAKQGGDVPPGGEPIFEYSEKEPYSPARTKDIIRNLSYMKPEKATAELEAISKERFIDERKPEIEYLPSEGKLAHAGEPISQEALTRQKKYSFYKYDSTSKSLIPLLGPEAIDSPLGKGEAKIQLNKNTGKFDVLDVGEGVVVPDNIKELLKQQREAEKKPVGSLETMTTADIKGDKKFIDDNLMRIAQEENYPIDHPTYDIAELLGDAYRNFNAEKNTSKSPEQNLRNFVINRKIRNTKPGGEKSVRAATGKSPASPIQYPEKETAGMIPATETTRAPHEAREMEAKESALDFLESIASENPKLKKTIGSLREGKTLKEVAKEEGISMSQAHKRRVELRKNAQTVLDVLSGDEVAKERASKRYQKLESKRISGKPLSPKEAVEHLVSKTIAEGPKTVDLGFLYGPLPKWAKSAMESMGNSMKELMGEKGEDVTSAVKVGRRGATKWIREMVTLPMRSKRFKLLAQQLSNADYEMARVVNRAEGFAKPYLKITRDNPGAAERINSVLVDENKSRSLFSESQLAQKYKLTKEDIGAYRGVRKAIRHLQNYEMWKHRTALNEALDKILSKEKESISKETMGLLSKAVTDNQIKIDLIKGIDHLKAKRTRVGRLFDDTDKARLLAGEHLTDLAEIDSHYRDNPGYIPQSRFGRYAIKIKGIPVKQEGVLTPIEGKAIMADFSMFDLPSQAKRFAEQYKVGDVVDFDGKKFKITEITDPKNPIDMKEAGVHPEGFMRAANAFPVYERILSKALPDEQVDLIRNVLGEETLKYLAKGRLARRKNVAGWSQDIGKNLEDFFQSFPRAISRRYAVPKAWKIIESLPKGDYEYGKNLLKYWQGEIKEGRFNQGVRSLIYNWYLGLKPSFYVVNSSQPLITSFPTAQSMVGLKGALKVMDGANKKVIRILGDYIMAAKKDPHVSLVDITREAPYLSIAEKRAIQRMAEGGEIGAARTKEIIGKKRWFSGPASAFASLSEKQNRLHAALMGTEIAKMKGMNTAEAIDLARDFNQRTQFVYNKANRMAITRGAMAPVTMFKSFMANYLKLQEELWKTDKKSFATSAAILIGLGGLSGLPLADILEKAIPAALKAVGIIKDEKPFNQQVYDIKKSIEGTSLGTILLHGLPALAKISGEYTFGAGELLGFAPLSMYQNIKNTVSSLNTPEGADVGEVLARLAPTEPKHLIRLFQLWVNHTMPTDVYGRPKLSEEDLKHMPRETRVWAIKNWKELPKPEDVSTWEKIMYGMGFPTETIRKYQEGVYAIKSTGREVSQEKAGMNRLIGKMISKSSDEKVKAWLLKTTPSAFESNFRTLLKKLPESDRKKIQDIIDEAKRKKIALSMSSILTNAKEYSQ